MKIQKADPAARRKSLLVVGLAGIALLVAGLVLGFDASDRIDVITEYLHASPRSGVVAMAIGAVPIVLARMLGVLAGG